jgi:hypothetical protein
MEMARSAHRPRDEASFAPNDQPRNPSGSPHVDIPN